MYGQLIGFLAMFVSFFIYQQNKRSNMVAIKLITDILWATHFYVIGSITAMVTTTIAIVREVVFYNTKKGIAVRLWIAVFSVVFLLSAVVTWKSIFSLLPALSSVITTTGFAETNPKRMKIMIIPATVGMFIYNLNCKSIAGIINEILTMVSIISFFAIRYYKKRKRRMMKGRT